MLWLAYAQGASHDEIAQMVGVRASSMKVLLSRARKKLAAALGGSRVEGIS
jgi:RNA polymerase sigma-70 factor (ECF subfamily)